MLKVLNSSYLPVWSGVCDSKWGVWLPGSKHNPHSRHDPPVWLVNKVALFEKPHCKSTNRSWSGSVEKNVLKLNCFKSLLTVVNDFNKMAKMKIGYWRRLLARKKKRLFFNDSLISRAFQCRQRHIGVSGWMGPELSAQTCCLRNLWKCHQLSAETGAACAPSGTADCCLSAASPALAAVDTVSVSCLEVPSSWAKREFN